MKNSQRILFYVPGLDVIKSGVYYSQVFGLARYLAGQGAECLVVYTYYGDDSYGESVREGVTLLNCPQDPKYIPLPFLPKKLFRSVAPALDRIRAFRPTHIYVRDAFAGVSVLSLARELGAKIVFSCRGAGMAAGSKSLKDYVKEGLLKWTMWRLLRHSDHVNGVCDRLNAHIRGFYRYSGPMSMLPCCVMPEKFEEIPLEERIACRRELAIPEDAKVVLYSGGMGWYQCSEELLELFRQLHDADPSLVFLVLTQAMDTFKALLEKSGLPASCVRMRSCLPQEVARYQQSADVGVILRKDDVLNNLASPVKIGEYLSAGLGIVVSPWIGDVGALLAREPFALMHKPGMAAADICAFVRSVGEEERRAARAFARSYYTYEGNCKAVESMFRDLR